MSGGESGAEAGGEGGLAMSDDYAGEEDKVLGVQFTLKIPLLALVRAVGKPDDMFPEDVVGMIALQLRAAMEADDDDPSSFTALLGHAGAGIAALEGVTLDRSRCSNNQRSCGVTDQ